MHYAAGDNLFQNDGEGDPVEVMKVLIEAGASLDLQNDAGMTALDIAIANGHDEIAQLLRDAGAQESP